MGYSIRRAAHVIQSDANRRLKPLGLRMISYSVLTMIVNNPGLRQAHLAQSLSIERPNLVTIVDELQNAGWVTRDPDPYDRRAFACTPPLSDVTFMTGPGNFWTCTNVT